MVNKYYQKYKERHRKEARETYKIFLKKINIKHEKRLKKDIKILLKKKKEGVCIIRNVKRSYVTIEEIIIQ